MSDVAPPPRLERPPITEVVCGFMFHPIVALDPFEFGVYWDQRRDDFPDKQSRVGLADPGTLSLHTRAWLISANDGELLLQLQSDRFYVNWRRRDDEYPHFSDQSEGPGLKSVALREFARFSAFCQNRPTIQASPDLTHVELTKIDILRRGHEWSSLEDLSELLPITGAFTTIRRSNRIQFSLSEREEMPEGTLTVQISSTTDKLGDMDTVRIESRASLALIADRQPEDAFALANDILNQAFFSLIPNAEQRFGRKD